MAQKRDNRDFVGITEDDQYLFAQGTHYEIYEKLGAHPAVMNQKKGVYFSIWAPNAREVFLVGSFNEWNETSLPMNKLGPGGIYDLFVENIEEGELYKFLIVTQAGEKLYKADPYANHAQLRPETASRIIDLGGYKWTDATYLEERKKKKFQTEALAIYECHIGSWMRHVEKKDEDGFYSYREFADALVEYLKDLKFTHVELMGIAEHPFDGSWGYQVTGYYAPTSRYGTPKDFMYLVNKLHKHKIGVILDWVPAHFPRDAFGLAEFDGTCLYEHPDTRKGEHPDWGTKIFNYEKTEVQNFLIANALFWAKEYHIDGLRVDAVASMLYLDYGKNHGQWVANKYGDNKNLEAIDFLKHLNSIMSKRHNDVMMIAEESTAWPKVTGSVEEDGLGFTFKWNMGWMHDFCEYMKLDPFFRKGNHYKMTFAMSYNHAENYILPLSHDEVVHLKCSMLLKMPGYYVDKFANLRVGYSYMFSHSGKKLLFMGQEFGQDSEWSEAKELDWDLLGDNLHASLKKYVSKLLELYRKYPAMYENDQNWDGFEWMNADDQEQSVYTYVRRTATKKNSILITLNMTPIERREYKIKVPKAGKYKVILNSDALEYGGSGSILPTDYTAKKEVINQGNGEQYFITCDLPSYGALFFLFQG